MIYTCLLLAGYMLLISLVLKPSHRPGFDRLQHAKTEGGGLVYFIIRMMSLMCSDDIPRVRIMNKSYIQEWFYE